MIRKPQVEFFERILDRLGMDVRDCSKVIMVGDSERNDIAPAKKMGMITVRYLNDRNPKDASWIDSEMRTDADHSYRDPEELKTLIPHLSTY